MEKIKRSTFIEAPPAKVFEYLHDPVNHLEFWPSLVEVTNVKRKPDGTTQSNDWTYKMAGLKFHGHNEFIEVQRDRLILWKGEGGINSKIRWLLEPRDGGTDFNVEVEYELPPTLLAKLAAPFLRRLNEHETDACMHNVKERMEAKLPA